MAINPQTTDTVTIPQLDPLVLALETFLVGANADGKMGNYTAQQLTELITPYVANLGASGFVPVSANVLPNPVIDEIRYSIVGTGTYTWSGGSLLTTELINIVSSNGVTWSIVVAIPVNLTRYVKNLDYNVTKETLEAVTTIDNLFVRTSAQENKRYITADGTNPDAAGYMSFLLDAEPSMTYRVKGNGTTLSYVRFTAAMGYIGFIVPTVLVDGSFAVTATSTTEFIGITLMMDGGFDRNIIIQRGIVIHPPTLKLDSIDDKEDIVLETELFDISTNLINKSNIIFGGQMNSGSPGGPVVSDQMYTLITPVPEAGDYNVSGVLNLTVIGRQLNGIRVVIPRVITGSYFTFVMPPDITELALNLAATSADWGRSETAMLESGLIPSDTYQPYGRWIKDELIDEAFIRVNIIKSVDRPVDPADGSVFYDKDKYVQLTTVDGVLTPANGDRRLTDYVGKIYEWDFAGGSLAADNVTKSVGMVVDSETYTTDTSYQIDVLEQSDQITFLRLGDGGVHTYEFGHEILDFTLDRIGVSANAQVGVMYLGETIGGLRSAFSGIGNNLAILRDWSNTTYAAAPYITMTQPITLSVGNKYRAINEFYGGGRRVSIYDITTTQTLLSVIDLVWPSNGYASRPNNRAYGIGINDMGITVNAASFFSDEPYRTETIILSDSIGSSRVATAYEKGWSKLATQFMGVGNILHTGGSNTTEDLLVTLQDTIDRKPKRVILSIGTNDCNLTKANRYTNMQTIVANLEAEGIEVIICKIIPADGLDSAPHIARWTRILDWNTFIDTTFGSTNRIIDFFTPLLNIAGDDWNLTYRADELHPNDAGHLVLFNTIKPYL